MPENGATAKTSPNHAPIAIIDASTLCNLASGHQRFLQRGGSDALGKKANPLSLLNPLIERGECTLIIPRMVLAESFTLNAPSSTLQDIQGCAPKRGSGNADSGYPALLKIDPNKLCNKERVGMAKALNYYATIPFARNEPQLRYYLSPQAFIDAGELTARKGGIVIVDTPEAVVQFPLNGEGIMTTSQRQAQRGDEQIKSIVKAVNAASENNIHYPVISDDYVFLNTHIDRRTNGKLSDDKPFPLNTRALISSYFDRGKIGQEDEALLYELTNPPQDKHKTPQEGTKWRNDCIKAASAWIRSVMTPPRTVVSNAQLKEKAGAGHSR